MSSNVSATLGPIVTLLSAAVIAVPLFRKLGLGSVLAYFAAGLLVGPSGVRLFTDPQAILHFSELGVVMFLFIIGLEMRPQRLWSMRRDIFGLGLAQVLLCTALLTAAGLAAEPLAPGGVCRGCRVRAFVHGGGGAGAQRAR